MRDASTQIPQISRHDEADAFYREMMKKLPVGIVRRITDAKRFSEHAKIVGWDCLLHSFDVL